MYQCVFNVEGIYCITEIDIDRWVEMDTKTRERERACAQVRGDMERDDRGRERASLKLWVLTFRLKEREKAKETKEREIDRTEQEH